MKAQDCNVYNVSGSPIRMKTPRAVVEALIAKVAVQPRKYRKFFIVDGRTCTVKDGFIVELKKVC